MKKFELTIVSCDKPIIDINYFIFLLRENKLDDIITIIELDPSVRFARIRNQVPGTIELVWNIVDINKVKLSNFSGYLNADNESKMAGVCVYATNVQESTEKCLVKDFPTITEKYLIDRIQDAIEFTETINKYNYGFDKRSSCY